MKLGDILRSAQSARPINPRPVSYNALGENEHSAQVKALVPAVLIAVNENQREQLRQDVEADLAKRFPGKEIVGSVRRDEEIYHLLFLALRDKDGSAEGFHAPLADTLTELRASLSLEEARRLKDEYERFMEEEFPSKIDQATWAKLIEDAKKNSLNDLLTAYGYESAVRALSFLAGRSST